MMSKKQKDPVCGMDVDPSHASHKVDHHGKTYCFCSKECEKKFKDKPQQYQK